MKSPDPQKVGTLLSPSIPATKSHLLLDVPAGPSFRNNATQSTHSVPSKYRKVRRNKALANPDLPFVYMSRCIRDEWKLSAGRDSDIITSSVLAGERDFIRMYARIHSVHGAV